MTTTNPIPQFDYQDEHDAGLHGRYRPPGCPVCWPGGASSPEPSPETPELPKRSKGNLASAMARVKARIVVDQPNPERVPTAGDPNCLRCVDLGVSPFDGGPMCHTCHGGRWLRKQITDRLDPELGKAVPCPDCVTVTHDRRLQRLLGGLPLRMRNWTLDTFPVADKHAAGALAQIREWLDDPAEPWLFLYGQSGVGKTGLAIGALRALCERGWGCAFSTVPDLLDAIRNTYGKTDDMTYDETMVALKEVRLLVLDDLGKERPSDWTAEKVYQLISGRHANLRRTIVTSNLALEALESRSADAAPFTRISQAATSRYCVDMEALTVMSTR